MKIRLGFVSNSSSASYVVNKNGLSDETVQKIIDHWELASKIIGELLKKEYPWCLEGHEYHGNDAWNVQNERKHIHLSTIMTNFPMLAYLKAIGVPYGNITIEDDDHSHDPYINGDEV